MIKQRCKIATNNVNFTYDDNERPFFVDNKGTGKTPQEIKNTWRDNVFQGPFVNCSYNELSTLNASINIEYNNLKNVRNTNYVYVEVHGEDKYYFVTSVTIKNERVATLSLRLDSVTTYLDTIKFTNDLLVKRRHFDRYVKKDGKWVINKSEDSGIWNVEQDIPSQNFIPVDIKPIDVLPKGRTDAMKDNFWPVAIMKQHDYGDLTYKYEYNSKIINNIPFFGSLWFIGNDWLRVRAHFKDGTSAESELVNITDLGIMFPSYVQKVVASPLPLWKQEDITFENPDGQAGHMRLYLELKDGVIFDDNKGYQQNGQIFQPVYGLDINGQTSNIPSYVLAPSNIATNGLVKYDTFNDHTIPYQYSATIDLPDVVKHSYDSLSITDRITDPKIFSSQHTRHIISSINGQHTDIVNEYIFDDDRLKINIDHAITPEGVTQFIRIANTYYDKHNKDNSKTLTISYKDQYPNPSDPYANWLASNSNQFKTAQANTRRSQLWNAASSIAQGALSAIGSFASGGISASTNQAVLGANKALGQVNSGLGLAGGIIGAGSALIQGKNRLKELSAKKLDIMNIGATTELDDVSFIKDMATLRHTSFGDSKLAFSTYMPTNIQVKRIDSYYRKFGYECENLEPVNDYTYFNKRAKFSYFETASFKTCVDKSSVPVEVVDDLERIFGEGIRLWNVKEDGSVNMSDFHTENWELPVYNELTK